MAIRSCVTISLVAEAKGGPFVFTNGLADGCKRAKELGFDAVEIFAPDAQTLADETSRVIEKSGLQVGAVGTGAGWVKHKLQLCDRDEAKREKARSFVRSIIEAGAALGAPAIIGSMQGRWGDGVDPETAMGWLTEALNDLGEHARHHGVPLFFEPLNRYETNMVNSLEAGVRLLRTLRTQNVKLLADFFHQNIEEADMTVAIRAARGLIGHVHWADSNRRPAGCGHTDFAAAALALREIEYRGCVSAEVLPYPDSQTAAWLTIESYRRYFKGE